MQPHYYQWTHQPTEDVILLTVEHSRLEACPPAYDPLAAPSYVEGNKVEVDRVTYSCNPYLFEIYCTLPSFHPKSPGGTPWEDTWEEVFKCKMDESLIDLATSPSRKPTRRPTTMRPTIKSSKKPTIDPLAKPSKKPVSPTAKPFHRPSNKVMIWPYSYCVLNIRFFA